jgi:hypothetical protein
MQNEQLIMDDLRDLLVVNPHSFEVWLDRAVMDSWEDEDEIQLRDSWRGRGFWDKPKDVPVDTSSGSAHPGDESE